MSLFKMRYCDTAKFEKALTACVMAFGCITVKKRTLIWITAFEEGDEEVIRETLVQEGGSSYAGRFKPEQL